MNKRSGDPLLRKMEQQVSKLLNDDKLTNSERLKAIEVGAKLLMIRHKITDNERAEGAFFDRSQ